MKPMLLKEIEEPMSDSLVKKYKDWIWEEKHNGERALIHIKDGRVTAIRNREDNSRIPQWPDVANLTFNGIKSAIIDCEVCHMKAGKSIFYDGINQRRGANPTRDRVEAFPITVIAFDLVFFDGSPVVNKPCEERIALLNSNFKDMDGFQLVKPILDPRAYWDNVILPENREGFVIKNPKSQYYPDRRTDCWLKLKNYKRADVIVEALVPNPKGVKIIGKTKDGIEGEIQWSFSGFENIKIGDAIEVEFLDVVNNKMVQPHKCKGVVIE
jgi:bifunctional non-homologous end joining protein LigD